MSDGEPLGLKLARPAALAQANIVLDVQLILLPLLSTTRPASQKVPLLKSPDPPQPFFERREIGLRGREVYRRIRGGQPLPNEPRLPVQLSSLYIQPSLRNRTPFKLQDLSCHCLGYEGSRLWKLVSFQIGPSRYATISM